jgi:hypothetical protein
LFALPSFLEFFADLRVQRWTWKSKEVSPLIVVCCFQFQEYVYFQALREPVHLLFELLKVLHPIVDWTLSIIWYEPIRTLLFVMSDWKSILNNVCHNLVISILWFCFWPFLPQRIFLLFHKFVYALPILLWNLIYYQHWALDTMLISFCLVTFYFNLNYFIII